MTEEEQNLEPVDQPRSGRWARAVTGIFATRAAVYPMAFVVSILVARALGAHDRGVYAFLLLLSGMIVPLCTFGFGVATVYYLSKAEYQSRDVTLTCMIVGAAQGVLAALVFATLVRLGVFGEAGAATPSDLLHLTLYIAPAQGLVVVGRRVLHGDARFAAMNGVKLARAILFPLTLALMVVVLDRGIDGAIFAMVGTDTLMAVLTTVLLLRGRRARIRFDLSFLRQGFRYGIRVWIGMLGERSSVRLDHMLLAAWWPAARLGTYAMASRIAELLWLLPDSIGVVMLNRLTKAASPEERARLAARVCRITLLGLAVLALIGGVVGWWVVPILLGPDYVGVELILALLLPGVVVRSVVKAMVKYFAASGKPELSGTMGVIGALTSATLYFGFIPAFGTEGAAVASSTSYAFSATVAMFIFHRGQLVPWWHLLVARSGDVRWLTSQLRLVLRRSRRTGD